MSVNPFTADPTVPQRLTACAAGVAEAVAPLLRDGVLPAQDAARLVARFHLAGVADLMLLMLPLARALARPPISDFHVGAVGCDTAGDLILGRNVEFPGAHLGYTLHGEGFLATRAFHRQTRLTLIALGEAHPCAHCRQFLSEFSGSADLTLIDPLGHRLTLAQLYPWPFDPAYLGQTGADGAAVACPDLTPETPISAALLQAGQRAHTPYSRCPAAIQLTLRDGSILCGSAMESVAFNPTVAPLMAAVVELLARGHDYGDIASATLGQAPGPVDFAQSTRELLHAIAPTAPLTLIRWQP